MPLLPQEGTHVVRLRDAREERLHRARQLRRDGRSTRPQLFDSLRAVVDVPPVDALGFPRQQRQRVRVTAPQRDVQDVVAGRGACPAADAAREEEARHAVGVAFDGGHQGREAVHVGDLEPGAGVLGAQEVRAHVGEVELGGVA